MFVEPAIAGRRGAAVQRDSDDRVPEICQHDLLGGDFGLGINTQRIGPGGLVVVSLAAVENQIAGNENEGNVGGQPGQASGGFDIHLSRQRRIFLASRAAAQRRAVDDELGSCFVKISANGITIGEVKMPVGQAGDSPV